MIQCPKCGELNADSRSSCFHCGASLRRGSVKTLRHCPRCGEELVTGSKDCPSCGAELVLGRDPNRQEPPESKVDYVVPELGMWLALRRGDHERARELFMRSRMYALIGGGIAAFVLLLALLFGLAG